MKIFLLLSILLISLTSNAQNLVPNFSFEEYSTCPDAQDQIERATGWSKYSEAITTPDYYNACAPSTSFGVPKSIAGFQPDHRSCNAYAGLVIWDGNGYREHIGIQLSQPLIIGQRYFISFYTVFSEGFIDGNYFSMPSNNIGLRLSTVAYNSSSPAPIDNFAHLNYSTILNDSINWTRVSGSLIADASYNYLVLGNFFNNSNTDTMHYNCGSCINSASYYYIDDICLSIDSALCNGGIDVMPCVVSVNEIDYMKFIRILLPT